LADKTVRVGDLAKETDRGSEEAMARAWARDREEVSARAFAMVREMNAGN
jgi:hypothetical protein